MKGRPKQPHRGQTFRELVMITSVVLVVVTVSFGIYQDGHAQDGHAAASNPSQLTQLEHALTGLLPR